MSNVMLAKDSISAALAQCYVTIGERRYNLMTAIKMEAKFKKIRRKFLRLEKPVKEINPYRGKELVLARCITIPVFSRNDA